MKSSVAIVLIIVGALLVITPPVSDYFFRRDLASVITSRSDLNHLTMAGETTGMYRFGCWLLGGIMIGTSIVGTVKAKRE